MKTSILLASIAVFLSVVIVFTLARRKTCERIALAAIASQKEIEVERLRHPAAERDKRIAKLLKGLDGVESGEKSGGADRVHHREKPEMDPPESGSG